MGGLYKIENEIKASEEFAAANDSVQLAEQLKSNISEIQKRKKPMQMTLSR